MYTTVSLDNFFKSQNQLERTIKGGAEVDEKSSILEGGVGRGGGYRFTYRECLKQPFSLLPFQLRAQENAVPQLL